MKMAKNFGVPEKRAVLIWLRSRLPDEYKDIIDVTGQKVAEEGVQYVPPPKGPDYSNTEELGLALFTEHLYEFEIAAVILLVAIVAAISLTMRRRPETKYQNPTKQVQVKARDRVRVVKMAAEEKG